MILSAYLLALALAAPQHEAPKAEASPSVAVAASPEAPAQDAAAHAATPEAAHAEAKPADGRAAAATTGEGHEGAGGEHGSTSAILMHHVTDEAEYHPFGLPIAFPGKHLFWMIAVMLLVIAAARLAVASYKNGAPSGVGSAIESLVVYVRDEIAEKNIGHGDGAKYTPLLLSFFFFILFAALVGLVPFTGTSTGNLSVTLALAFISFVAQMHAGISKYGVAGHVKNLVPHGIPGPLLPVMFIVEFLGMFTKPFALMIRLFANMLAGHMMITALLMLVPLASQISQGLGYAMVPISLGMALFIMCLEVLVAFIQAYVFTLFSAIFIGMYAHPSH
jgi:F-type H+-transporting ATPase subunit a